MFQNIERLFANVKCMHESLNRSSFISTVEWSLHIGQKEVVLCAYNSDGTFMVLAFNGPELDSNCCGWLGQNDNDELRGRV